MPPAMIMRPGFRSPREATPVTLTVAPPAATAPTVAAQQLLEPFTALTIEEALSRDLQWQRDIASNRGFAQDQ